MRPALCALLCLLALAACSRLHVTAEGSADDFDWTIGIPF